MNFKSNLIILGIVSIIGNISFAKSFSIDALEVGKLTDTGVISRGLVMRINDSNTVFEINKFSDYDNRNSELKSFKLIEPLNMSNFFLTPKMKELLGSSYKLPSKNLSDSEFQRLFSELEKNEKKSKEEKAKKQAVDQVRDNAYSFVRTLTTGIIRFEEVSETQESNFTKRIRTIDAFEKQGGMFQSVKYFSGTLTSCTGYKESNSTRITDIECDSIEVRGDDLETLSTHRAKNDFRVKAKK
jgi:hypothetical protein